MTYFAQLRIFSFEVTAYLIEQK